jgi:hypothetical protein
MNPNGFGQVFCRSFKNQWASRRSRPLRLGGFDTEQEKHASNRKNKIIGWKNGRLGVEWTL